MKHVTLVDLVDAPGHHGLCLARKDPRTHLPMRLYCPFDSSSDMKCGDWCAVFDVVEHAGERGQPAVRYATCRGTTIGVLTDDSDPI